jgi:hypothetical protein
MCGNEMGANRPNLIFCPFTGKKWQFTGKITGKKFVIIGDSSLYSAITGKKAIFSQKLQQKEKGSNVKTGIFLLFLPVMAFLARFEGFPRAKLARTHQNLPVGGGERDCFPVR